MVRFLRVTPRLPIADLRRSLDFYRDELGFGVEVSWPEGDPTLVLLERDGARIGLFTGERAGPDERGYAEIYVDVDDALTLHEELAARIAIEWGPEVYSYGCREFAVRDPDGYLVIFTEDTDDAPTTTEPAEPD